MATTSHLRRKKLNCPSNTSNITLTTWSASQHFNSEPAWRFISPTSSSNQTVAHFANRTCRFQFVCRYYCHVCNSWLVIPNIQNCWEYLQLVFHSLSYTCRMYCSWSSIIVDVLLMTNNHLLLIIIYLYIYIYILLMYYGWSSTPRPPSHCPQHPRPRARPPEGYVAIAISYRL